MSKIIGRKFNVGIGKESSRGTAVAADFWLPKMDFSHDDKIEFAVHESSIGVIADAEGQDITGKIAEGELSGRIADTSFGLWLLATLGTAASPSLVATGVYDHVFTILESAQHPSLTFDVREANDGGSGLRYPLSMVDSFEVNFELGKYGEYKAAWRSNTPSSASNTASFSAENIFLPQHGEVKFATNLAGLGAASAIQVKKATFKISKNIEDDQVLGSLNSIDRLNKQFSVEGSIELMYEDRSYIDTIMLGDLQKALRIKFANTGTTIGVGSNPTITFDFAKVKIQEVARSIANNDLIKQTINFKVYYSIADTSLMTATLRNTRSAQY